MGTANYHLFRSGRVWHVRFQIDGKRTQLSTKETDRQRAEKVAERAWRKAALWSRDGKEIPTLRELTKMWLEVHTPTVSTSHAKIVETFGRLHLFGLADIEIDRITTEMVEATRLEWLKTRAPVSANQSLKVLRLLCGWAIKRGMLPAMPFHVRTLKIQKRVRAILPTALVQDWLAVTLVRIEHSRKSAKGVRIQDLARYIDTMPTVGAEQAKAASARAETPESLESGDLLQPQSTVPPAPRPEGEGTVELALERALTLKMAADLLKVSYGTVYAHREELGFFQIGSVWRVWPATLRTRLAAKQEEKARPRETTALPAFESRVPSNLYSPGARKAQIELDKRLAEKPARRNRKAGAK